MKHPVDREALPTAGQLRWASAGALALGAVLLVVAVLPAEWGVDPTGAGGALGLTAMGELKQAEAVALADAASYREHADRLTLKLRPNQGTEVKVALPAGGELEYAWSTDGTALFYDFHGEPKGAAPDVFTSFEKGTRNSALGTFEAPFEGVHGWYWKNRSTEPVTLQLKTSGVYHSFGER